MFVSLMKTHHTNLIDFPLHGEGAYLFPLRACLVTSGESPIWGFLTAPWTGIPRRGFVCIVEDFTSITVCIHAYSWEKVVLMCRSTEVRISKSFGGRSGLKSLKNEHFHCSKSLGICNCQTWVFHDFMEAGNLLAENLVATTLKIEIGYIRQFASISSIASFGIKKKKIYFIY